MKRCVVACLTLIVTSHLALGCVPTQRATLSLPNLSCAGCGSKVVKFLEQHPAVNEVAFDQKRAEVRLSYQHQRIAINALATAAGRAAKTAVVVGGGRGSYAPAAKFDAAWDVKTIVRDGSRVTLRDHVVPGKVTVFDFFAVWCGPCKDIDRLLVKLFRERRGFAVRKIDVVSWSKPVAKQHLGKVKGLPYLVIFDQRGRRVKGLAGSAAKRITEELRPLLERTARPTPRATAAAVMPSAPGVALASATGWRVSRVGPEKAAAGKTVRVSLRVHPGAGRKIAVDFPHRVKLTRPCANVALSATKTDADGVLPSAVDRGRVVFGLPLLARGAGVCKAQAQVSSATCTSDTCTPFTTRVPLALSVGPGAP